MQVIGTCALFVVALSGAVIGLPEPGRAKNYLCDQQFDLCTSAPCIPQPGNPKIAMCTCNVQEGPNLATVECDTVKPSTNSDGIRTAYSQFMLTQFEQGKKGLKCARGTPWTWCLNKVCTVDPANPKKAICACDVIGDDLVALVEEQDAELLLVGKPHRGAAIVEHLRPGGQHLPFQHLAAHQA